MLIFLAGCLSFPARVYTAIFDKSCKLTYYNEYKSYLRFYIGSVMGNWKLQLYDWLIIATDTMLIFLAALFILI